MKLQSLLFVALIAAAPAHAAAITPKAEPPDAASTATAEIVLEVFTRDGCTRCAAAKEFLAVLAHERPNIRIVERKLDSDPGAIESLQAHARSAGIATPGVPLFVVRGAVVVGFDSAETTGRVIRNLLEGHVVTPNAGATCEPDKPTTCPPSETQPVDSVNTTLFGRLSLSKLGMPLFTLAVGLLDGFNPCAMWVLVFLLSMLASLHDRPRMAIVAGTFVFASGAVYYAFMAAWLNIFLIMGMSRAIEVTLGLVALAMGALNVKDYVAFKRGLSLTIPDSRKPQIYARVRSVIRADRLVASLAGVIVLAVLVNFIELLCTAGFPAVYTAILTRQGLPWWQHYAYLGLYIVAYILDDTLMVVLAVVTLSRRKMTESAGRWLKLVSGVVMLGLAVMLLMWPEHLH